MNGACNVKLFWPRPFQLQSISKIFIPNFVFSQMKDTKHIRRDLHSVAGGAQGVKKFQTWSGGISNRRG